MYNNRLENKKNIITVFDFFYGALFILVLFNGSWKNSIFGYSAEMLAILSLLTVLAKLFENKDSQNDKIFFNSTIVIYMIFYLYVVLGLFFAIDSNSVKPFIYRFFAYGLILVFGIKFVKLDKLFQIAKIYILINCIIMLILYPFLGKNGGLLGNYQVGAGTISVAIIFIIVEFIVKKDIMLNDFLLFLIMLVALFSTGKRTYSLIVIFGVFFLLIFSKGDNKLTKLFMLSITLGISVLMVAMMIPEYFLVFIRFFEGLGDKTMTGRSYIWEYGFYLWESNKVFGVGFGNFLYTMIQNEAWVRANFGNISPMAAHNVYVQILTEGGIVGLTIFSIFLFTNLIGILAIVNRKKINADRNKKKMAIISLYFQIWFILYSITGNPLYMIDQFFVYIISLVIMINLKREEKNDKYKERCNNIRDHSSL